MVGVVRIIIKINSFFFQKPPGYETVSDTKVPQDGARMYPGSDVMYQLSQCYIPALYVKRSIAVKALRACNSATERQIAKSKPSGSSLKHGESADSKNSILNFSRTSHVFSFSVTYIYIIIYIIYIVCK